MKKNQNKPTLLLTIKLSMAGCPVLKLFTLLFMAKITGHNEIVTELENKFQSLTNSFIALKAEQARFRKAEAEKKRIMKDVDKHYRKMRKIIIQNVPKEKWSEFGIDPKK